MMRLCVLNEGCTFCTSTPSPRAPTASLHLSQTRPSSVHGKSPQSHRSPESGQSTVCTHALSGHFLPPFSKSPSPVYQKKKDINISTTVLSFFNNNSKT